MSYLILDIETGEKKYLHRNASPWKNDIIALSICNGTEQHTEYLSNKMVDFNIDEDVLVAFNAKFELSYLWNFKNVQEWLKNGGKIFDPQLFEYIKSGFTYKYPALRDVAVTLYKQPERIKWIEYYLFDQKNTLKNLESELEALDPGTRSLNEQETIYTLQEHINEVEFCTNMKDIPKDKVLEDVRFDVKDTEAIYLAEQKYIKDNNLENICEVFMDSLLATTEMEMNGFKVNSMFLEDQNTLLIEEIKQQETELMKLVHKYWELPEEFNYKSSVHLGLLLYGGVHKTRIKMPVILSNGEISRDKKGSVKMKLTDREKEIQGFSLIPSIFTKTGKPSTSKDTLAIIAKREPKTDIEKDLVRFCSLIIDSRTTAKDNKTYFQGILDCVYPDGCIRAQYQHVRTATARLSCKEPNLQNLTGKD